MAWVLTFKHWFEKSTGWTVLDVFNGLDLKVSKNRHIAPILIKRGRDRTVMTIATTSTQCPSWIFTQQSISIKFHSNDLTWRAGGVFYYHPKDRNPEAYEEMSK